MSATRVCAVALIVLASVASAAVTGDGCMMPMGSQRLYGNSSIACSAATTCQESYCTCVGGTANGGADCTYPSTMTTNCTAASECIRTMITCLNSASDMTTSCGGLADLHMSLLSIESSGVYNGSAAYQSCRYRSCMLLNASAGSNCTLNYMRMCPSPVVFSFTTLLRGAFTAAYGPAQIRSAFAADLTRFLGYVVRVIRAYLHGANRRQAGSQVMIVESQVDGVNANNAAFNTAFATVASANPATLFATVLAEYQAATGNALTLEVVGVSAGVGSSAFSGRGAAVVVNQLPSNTPQPGSGGAGSGTPNPAGSGTPSGSPSGSGTPVTPGSGAATQSLLAAVVVAVLSAMLF